MFGTGATGHTPDGMERKAKLIWFEVGANLLKQRCFPTRRLEALIKLRMNQRWSNGKVV